MTSTRRIGLLAATILGSSIGILTVLFTRRCVPEQWGESRKTRLDIRGSIVSILGLGAITFALIESSQLGFGDSRVLLTFAGGLLLMALFVSLESRTNDTFMPLSLFQSRAFIGANLCTLLL